MNSKRKGKHVSILVYGAGALGQALGCMLAQAGNHVDLLLRRRYIEAIKEKGLEVDGVLGTFQAPRENLGLLTNPAEAKNAYDYILISTKSYDTAQAIETIKEHSLQADFVVSMQNGCGNLEQLVEAFGGDCSLGARIITGFEIASPGRVHVSVTADAIHVGADAGGAIAATAEKLADLLTAAGHPCQAVADIHSSLYAKLLYNCALNPLGAILGVHYGALADNADTRRMMDAIIEETFAVIEAMGGCTPWQSADEYKEVFYGKLIPATYSHRPSMLQDLEGGKRTEVDALVGYVGEQGRRWQISTPTCDTVAAMVRFKETRNNES